MAPSTSAILRAYHARVGALRDGTADRLEQIWYALPNYREDNIDDFLDIIEPIVEASKERTAQLTSAYHQQMSRARGDDPPIPGVLLAGAALNQPRGVNNDTVYRRPANSLYTALSDGLSMTQAVERGATRLRSLITTDLQLVKTKQSQRSLQAGGFEYYRRVLNGNKNCALCVIASTQRYRVRDLLPIHPGCQCTVDTVRADFDPGQVIDDELLEQIHALITEELGVESDRGARDLGLQKLIETPAGETKLADYTELIFTRQHGEYGPTLTFRSHEFQERFLIGLSGPSTPSTDFGLTTVLKSNPNLTFTDFEETVMRNYTGNGFRDINKYLRENPDVDSVIAGLQQPPGNPDFVVGEWPDDRVITHVRHMDDVISRSTFNDSVTLYRGTSFNAFGDDDAVTLYLLGEGSLEDLRGLTFTAPAYVSTSTDPTVADGFIATRFIGARPSQTPGVRLEIRMQVGDVGLDVQATELTSEFLRTENEVILPRSSRFRVVDVGEVSIKDVGGVTVPNIVIEPVRD